MVYSYGLAILCDKFAKCVRSSGSLNTDSSSLSLAASPRVFVSVPGGGSAAGGPFRLVSVPQGGHVGRVVV